MTNNPTAQPPKPANPQPGDRFRDVPHDYDALLIVGFGGPEGMDEVIPFMENVLRGRNVPKERMVEVTHHYRLFDGVSPYNAQMRALIGALEVELAENGPHLPIYWGNRNWHPLLTDTMQQMADDGVKRALAFVVSAFSSYSGCRQYREDIAAAQAAVGEKAPIIDKIRVFYNHPDFIGPNADRIQDGLNKIPAERRDGARVVFTAHSIPDSMANNSDYVVQLLDSCNLITAALGLSADRWDLVYQSRSGPPHQPWLEPDICDHLEALHAQGLTDVVVAPIGFLSDHMEVLFDLDTEARELVDEIGLNMVRAETVGVHPDFIGMVRELILERMTENPDRRALGERGPNHDACALNCCQSGGGRPGGHPGAATTAKPAAANAPAGYVWVPSGS